MKVMNDCSGREEGRGQGYKQASRYIKQHEENLKLTCVVSATHLPISPASPFPASALCSTVAGTPTTNLCNAAGQSILYLCMNPSSPNVVVPFDSL